MELTVGASKQMKRCDGCRFWSDLVFKASVHEPAMAMCQNQFSKRHNSMTSDVDTCKKWRPTIPRRVYP